MKILDSIERSYSRLKAKARLYDGTEQDCTIYTDANGNFDRSNDKPPSERYIDILSLGAAHYGVKAEYIDWLKSHEFVPRAKVQDYLKFDIPEGLETWTQEQLEKGDALGDNPFYIAINGKVIQRTYPQDKP